MPEDQSQQVDSTKIVKGKVTFSFGPTPTILARVTKALRYFAVGLITMVSGSDIFNGGQAKMINFSLGVFILALGGVDLVIGVEPATDKAATLIGWGIIAFGFMAM